MTYVDSKKILDNIRRNEEYSCQGEIIFKTAILTVMEEGKVKLNDKHQMYKWFSELDREYEEAERQNKILVVSKNFQKAILKCAMEIACIETIDIFEYIRKEMRD